MRQVEAADVAVAVPAQPERVHFFSGQGADGRWSHQKPVLVEMLAARVVQIVAVEQQGVAGPDEVLPEVVHDAEVLAARVEDAIQPAIGVLLEGAKVDEVELITVGAQVAEDSGAESVVAEDEATEVAGERLDAETRRDEVVIGAEVAEVVFDEQLLEAHLTVQTRRALPDVDVHHAGVPGAEIVDVEDRRHAQLPVAWPEGRVALEELQGNDEVLIEEELITGTEEVGATGLIGAHVARQRDATELEEAVADRRDGEEVFLPEDRIVALENILMVRVPEPTAFEGGVLERPLVPVPIGEPEPPPVGNRHEVGARLRGDRPDRARPGFTEALFSGRRRLLHLQCIAIRDAAVRGQERYGEEYTFQQDEQSPTPSLAHTLLNGGALRWPAPRLERHANLFSSPA